MRGAYVDRYLSRWLLIAASGTTSATAGDTISERSMAEVERGSGSLGRLVAAWAYWDLGCTSPLIVQRSDRAEFRTCCSDWRVTSWDRAFADE